MGIDVHTTEQIDGGDFNRQDRVIMGMLADVANAAGGGAGTSVTTPVAMTGLPASYAVHVTPSQDATFYVTNKTTAGFDVVLTPRLAANTLAAGTFDVVVIA